MKRAAQKKIFSITMVVAILATSILACAFTPKNTGDSECTTSDQQCPFEESEKEFEDDKDENDEKPVVLVLIGEIFFSYTQGLSDQKIIAPTTGHTTPIPLFLTYHRFLI